MTTTTMPPTSTDPVIEVKGYLTDPKRSGYQVLTNYESIYWRALVGNNSWSLYEVLRSFCHHGNHICTPSIQLLTTILGLEDKRALIGRSKMVKGKEYRYPGLIESLQEHKLVIAEIQGETSKTHYVFHVNLTPDLLTNDQLARLPKILQKKHAELVKRCAQEQHELEAKRKPFRFTKSNENSGDAAQQGGGKFPRGVGNSHGGGGKFPRFTPMNNTQYNSTQSTDRAREEINNNSGGTSTISDVVVALSAPKIATETVIKPNPAVTLPAGTTAATTTHLRQASGNNASLRASASPPAVLIDPTVRTQRIPGAHGEAPLDPPAPVETDGKSNAAAALIAIGLAETVVNRLSTRYSEERIAEKIEFLDFLQAEHPERVQNPRGWLRRAIEENYGPPDGYQSAEQLAALAAQAQEQEEERQRMAAARAHQAQAALERQEQEETARLAHLQAVYGTTQRELDIWQQLLAEFKLSLPAATFTGYVADTVLLSVQEGTALIGLPNRSVRDWVENRFTKKIERSLASYLGGQKVHVTFVDLTADGFAV